MFDSERAERTILFDYWKDIFVWSQRLYVERGVKPANVNKRFPPQAL